MQKDRAKQPRTPLAVSSRSSTTQKSSRSTNASYHSDKGLNQATRAKKTVSALTRNQEIETPPDEDVAGLHDAQWTMHKDLRRYLIEIMNKKIDKNAIPTLISGLNYHRTGWAFNNPEKNRQLAMHGLSYLAEMNVPINDKALFEKLDATLKTILLEQYTTVNRNTLEHSLMTLSFLIIHRRIQVPKNYYLAIQNGIDELIKRNKQSLYAYYPPIIVAILAKTITETTELTDEEVSILQKTCIFVSNRNDFQRFPSFYHLADNNQGYQSDPWFTYSDSPRDYKKKIFFGKGEIGHVINYLESGKISDELERCRFIHVILNAVTLGQQIPKSYHKKLFNFIIKNRNHHKTEFYSCLLLGILLKTPKFEIDDTEFSRLIPKLHNILSYWRGFALKAFYNHLSFQKNRLSQTAPTIDTPLEGSADTLQTVAIKKTSLDYNSDWKTILFNWSEHDNCSTNKKYASLILFSGGDANALDKLPITPSECTSTLILWLDAILKKTKIPIGVLNKLCLIIDPDSKNSYSEDQIEWALQIVASLMEGDSILYRVDGTLTSSSNEELIKRKLHQILTLIALRIQKRNQNTLSNNKLLEYSLEILETYIQTEEHPSTDIFNSALLDCLESLYGNQYEGDSQIVLRVISLLERVADAGASAEFQKFFNSILEKINSKFIVSFRKYHQESNKIEGVNDIVKNSLLMIKHCARNNIIINTSLLEYLSHASLTSIDMRSVFSFLDILKEIIENEVAPKTKLAKATRITATLLADLLSIVLNEKQDVSESAYTLLSLYIKSSSTPTEHIHEDFYQRINKYISSENASTVPKHILMYRAEILLLLVEKKAKLPLNTLILLHEQFSNYESYYKSKIIDIDLLTFQENPVYNEQILLNLQAFEESDHSVLGKQLDVIKLILKSEHTPKKLSAFKNISCVALVEMLADFDTNSPQLSALSLLKCISDRKPFPKDLLAELSSPLIQYESHLKKSILKCILNQLTKFKKARAKDSPYMSEVKFIQAIEECIQDDTLIDITIKILTELCRYDYKASPQLIDNLAKTILGHPNCQTRENAYKLLKLQNPSENSSTVNEVYELETIANSLNKQPTSEDIHFLFTRVKEGKRLTPNTLLSIDRLLTRKLADVPTHEAQAMLIQIVETLVIQRNDFCSRWADTLIPLTDPTFIYSKDWVKLLVLILSNHAISHPEPFIALVKYTDRCDIRLIDEKLLTTIMVGLNTLSLFEEKQQRNRFLVILLTLLGDVNNSESRSIRTVAAKLLQNLSNSPDSLYDIHQDCESLFEKTISLYLEKSYEYTLSLTLMETLSESRFNLPPQSGLLLKLSEVKQILIRHRHFMSSSVPVERLHELEFLSTYEPFKKSNVLHHSIASVLNQENCPSRTLNRILDFLSVHLVLNPETNDIMYAILNHCGHPDDWTKIAARQASTMIFKRTDTLFSDELINKLIVLMKNATSIDECHLYSQLLLIIEGKVESDSNEKRFHLPKFYLSVQGLVNVESVLSQAKDDELAELAPGMIKFLFFAYSQRELSEATLHKTLNSCVKTLPTSSRALILNEIYKISHLMRSAPIFVNILENFDRDKAALLDFNLTSLNIEKLNLLQITYQKSNHKIPSNFISCLIDQLLTSYSDPEQLAILHLLKTLVDHHYIDISSQKFDDLLCIFDLSHQRILPSPSKSRIKSWTELATSSIMRTPHHILSAATHFYHRHESQFSNEIRHLAFKILYQLISINKYSINNIKNACQVIFKYTESCYDPMTLTKIRSQLPQEALSTQLWSLLNIHANTITSDEICNTTSLYEHTKNKLISQLENHTDKHTLKKFMTTYEIRYSDSKELMLMILDSIIYRIEINIKINHWTRRDVNNLLSLLLYDVFQHNGKLDPLSFLSECDSDISVSWFRALLKLYDGTTVNNTHNLSQAAILVKNVGFDISTFYYQFFKKVPIEICIDSASIKTQRSHILSVLTLIHEYKLEVYFMTHILPKTVEDDNHTPIEQWLYELRWHYLYSRVVHLNALIQKHHIHSPLYEELLTLPDLTRKLCSLISKNGIPFVEIVKELNTFEKHVISTDVTHKNPEILTSAEYLQYPNLSKLQFMIDVHLEYHHKILDLNSPLSQFHHDTMKATFPLDDIPLDIEELFLEFSKQNKALSISTVEDIKEIIRNSHLLHTSTRPHDGRIAEWDRAQIRAWGKNHQQRQRASDTNHLSNNTINIAEFMAVFTRAYKILFDTDPKKPKEFRNAQRLAFLALVMTGEGKFLQVITGEGKSIVIAMVAIWAVLNGHTLDIVTISPTYALRDAKANKPIFDIFGVGVAHNNEDTGYTEGTKPCYKDNIKVVYGTSSNFQFDILRHEYENKNTRGNRSFDIILIDEVDNLLLDEGAKLAMLAKSMPFFNYLNPLFIALYKRLQLLDLTYQHRENVELEVTQLLKEYALTLVNKCNETDHTLDESHNEAKIQALFSSSLPANRYIGQPQNTLDSFFDSCVQQLNNELSLTKYTNKSLRLLCHQAALTLDKQCDSEQNHPDNWIAKQLNDPIKYQQYLANIQYSLEDINENSDDGKNRVFIQGDPHIDGRLICEKLGIKIHIIEASEVPNSPNTTDAKTTLSHYLLHKNKHKTVDPSIIGWNDHTIVHLGRQGHSYYPILNNTEQILIPQHLVSYAKQQIDVWIRNAALAYYHYKEEHHYIIATDADLVDRIAPVDFANTGVTQNGTTWGDGLQQFLEIKHGLRISPDSLITNYLSNVAFIRRYIKKDPTNKTIIKNGIYGMTGTLGSAESKKLLSEIYYIGYLNIPTFRAVKTQLPSNIICDNRHSWMSNITLESIREASMGRIVLVLCETITSAKNVYEMIEKYKTNLTLTKYIMSDKNSSFLNETYQPGTIIVATNLAGRGTDIELPPAVVEIGGLDVIFTFLPDNLRVQDQGFGRGHRKGEPGTGRFVLNITDIIHKFRMLGSHQTQDLDFNDFDSILAKRDALEKILLDNIRAIELPVIIAKDFLFTRYTTLLDTLNPDLMTGLIDIKHKGRFNNSDNIATRSGIEERWGIWLKSYDFTKPKVLFAKKLLEEFFQDQRSQDYSEEYFALLHELISLSDVDSYDFLLENYVNILLTFLMKSKNDNESTTPLLKSDVTNLTISSDHLKNNWGLWLTKRNIPKLYDELIEFYLEDARDHFEQLSRSITDDLSSQRVIHNPCYYINLGNQILSELENFWFKSAYLSQYMTYCAYAIACFDKAINLDSTFSFIAYYNRSFVKIIAEMNHAKQDALSDLDNVKNTLSLLKKQLRRISEMYSNQQSSQSKADLSIQLDQETKVLDLLDDSINQAITGFENQDKYLYPTTYSQDTKRVYNKMTNESTVKVIHKWVEPTGTCDVSFHDLYRRFDFGQPNHAELIIKTLPESAICDISFDTHRLPIQQSQSFTLRKLLPMNRNKSTEDPKTVTEQTSSDDQPKIPVGQQAINAGYSALKFVYQAPGNFIRGTESVYQYGVNRVVDWIYQRDKEHDIPVALIYDHSTAATALHVFDQLISAITDLNEQLSELQLSAKQIIDIVIEYNELDYSQVMEYIKSHPNHLLYEVWEIQSQPKYQQQLRVLSSTNTKPASEEQAGNYRLMIRYNSTEILINNLKLLTEDQMTFSLQMKQLLQPIADQLIRIAEIPPSVSFLDISRQSALAIAYHNDVAIPSALLGVKSLEKSSSIDLVKNSETEKRKFAAHYHGVDQALYDRGLDKSDIEQYQHNGYVLLYYPYQKQYMPRNRIIIRSILGVVQIGIGIGLTFATAGFAVGMGGVMITEGLGDLLSAGNGIRRGELSFDGYVGNKVFSIGLGAALVAINPIQRVKNLYNSLKGTGAAAAGAGAGAATAGVESAGAAGVAGASDSIAGNSVANSIATSGAESTTANVAKEGLAKATFWSNVKNYFVQSKLTIASDFAKKGVQIGTNKAVLSGANTAVFMPIEAKVNSYQEKVSNQTKALVNAQLNSPHTHANLIKILTYSRMLKTHSLQRKLETLLYEKVNKLNFSFWHASEDTMALTFENAFGNSCEDIASTLQFEEILSANLGKKFEKPLISRLCKTLKTAKILQIDEMINIERLLPGTKIIPHRCPVNIGEHPIDFDELNPHKHQILEICFNTYRASLSDFFSEKNAILKLCSKQITDQTMNEVSIATNIAQLAIGFSMSIGYSLAQDAIMTKFNEIYNGGVIDKVNKTVRIKNPETGESYEGKIVKHQYSSTKSILTFDDGKIIELNGASFSNLEPIVEICIENTADYKAFQSGVKISFGGMETNIHDDLTRTLTFYDMSEVVLADTAYVSQFVQFIFDRQQARYVLNDRDSLHRYRLTKPNTAFKLIKSGGQKEQLHAPEEDFSLPVERTDMHEPTDINFDVDFWVYFESTLSNIERQGVPDINPEPPRDHIEQLSENDFIRVKITSDKLKSQTLMEPSEHQNRNIPLECFLERVSQTSLFLYRYLTFRHISYHASSLQRHYDEVLEIWSHSYDDALLQVKHVIRLLLILIIANLEERLRNNISSEINFLAQLKQSVEHCFSLCLLGGYAEQSQAIFLNYLNETGKDYESLNEFILILRYKFEDYHQLRYQRHHVEVQFSCPSLPSGLFTGMKNYQLEQAVHNMSGLMISNQPNRVGAIFTRATNTHFGAVVGSILANIELKVEENQFAQERINKFLKRLIYDVSTHNSLIHKTLTSNKEIKNKIKLKNVRISADRMIDQTKVYRTIIGQFRNKELNSDEYQLAIRELKKQNDEFALILNQYQSLLDSEENNMPSTSDEALIDLITAHQAISQSILKAVEDNNDSDSHHQLQKSKMPTIFSRKEKQRVSQSNPTSIASNTDRTTPPNTTNTSSKNTSIYAHPPADITRSEALRKAHADIFYQQSQNVAALKVAVLLNHPQAANIVESDAIRNAPLLSPTNIIDMPISKETKALLLYQAISCSFHQAHIARNDSGTYLSISTAFGYESILSALSITRHEIQHLLLTALRSPDLSESVPTMACLQHAIISFFNTHLTQGCNFERSFQNLPYTDQLNLLYLHFKNTEEYNSINSKINNLMQMMVMEYTKAKEKLSKEDDDIWNSNHDISINLTILGKYTQNQSAYSELLCRKNEIESRLQDYFHQLVGNDDISRLNRRLNILLDESLDRPWKKISKNLVIAYCDQFKIHYDAKHKIDSHQTLKTLLDDKENLESFVINYLSQDSAEIEKNLFDLILKRYNIEIPTEIIPNSPLKPPIKTTNNLVILLKDQPCDDRLTLLCKFNDDADAEFFSSLKLPLHTAHPSHPRYRLRSALPSEKTSVQSEPKVTVQSWHKKKGRAVNHSSYSPQFFNSQQSTGTQELSLPASSQPNIIESRHGDTIYSLEKIGVLHDGTCGFYSLFCTTREEIQKLHTPQFASRQQEAEYTAIRRSYRTRGVDILLSATAQQRELLIPDMIQCYSEESSNFYKRDSEGVKRYIQAHELEIRFSEFIRDLAPKFGVPTENLLEEEIYQRLVAKRDSEENPELNQAFIPLNKVRDDAHNAKQCLDNYVHEKVIQDLHIKCEYQDNSGWLNLGAARLIARCLGKNLIVWAHNVSANTLTYHHENDSHRRPNLEDLHICYRPGFWDIIKVVNIRPAAEQLPSTGEPLAKIISL